MRLGSKIKIPTQVSMAHILKFISFWMQLHNINLEEGIEDHTIWKFITSGHYTAASAYMTQFLGGGEGRECHDEFFFLYLVG